MSFTHTVVEQSKEYGCLHNETDCTNLNDYFLEYYRNDCPFGLGAQAMKYALQDGILQIAENGLSAMHIEDRGEGWITVHYTIVPIEGM